MKKTRYSLSLFVPFYLIIGARLNYQILTLGAASQITRKIQYIKEWSSVIKV